MQVIEVADKATVKDFLTVNVLMNQNSPHYIRPLDNDINEVFDPLKNKYHQYGEAKRWIAIDENGSLLGRIAAFTNSKYINKGTEFKTGSIGFFESIDDQPLANILFDTAKAWLESKGMEAMDGPINFGDRDKWWGLMVEGFESEPMYGMPFNPSYYEMLFNNYGFKNYYNQYYFTMIVDDPFPPRFSERHAKFKAKSGYEAKHMKLSNLEKCAKDFATVYNAAWAQHGEEKEIYEEQVLNLFNKIKPILDERTIWFAYYLKEPIAMFINIPDMNQYFKYFNGKFGWFEKLRLWWMKQMGYNKRLTGVAFGVVPKYQALGVDSFMIYECGLLLQGKGWYTQYEMGWTGDWNPRMINIYKSLGGRQSRVMVTYRYLFDQNHPFERHPLMEYK